NYALDYMTRKYLPGFKHEKYEVMKEWLAQNQLQVTTDEGKSGQNFSLAPIQVLGEYALEDLDATRQLVKKFERQKLYPPVDNFGCASRGTIELIKSDMLLVK